MHGVRIIKIRHAIGKVHIQLGTNKTYGHTPN